MTKSFSRRIAVAGLFAAAAMALSFAESMLPSVIPAARLGLANVAVTAAVWLLGAPTGGAVAAVKVLFVFVTRGIAAGLMALGGTVLAFAATVLLLPLYKRSVLTFVGVSITAAAAHTAGQLMVASLWLSVSVIGYAPFMLFMSLLSGTLTGLVLNAVIPRLPVRQLIV